MSTTEVDRFMKDVQQDAKLASELKGIGNDPVKVTAFANQLGYRFTREEALACAADHGELADDRLDKVAGGMFAYMCDPLGPTINGK